MRPADFGPFVPIDSQPAKAVQDGGQCRLDVPLGVGVVDAQQKLSAMPPGEQPIEQGRADAADVQISGRTGSKTSANHECCRRALCRPASDANAPTIQKNRRPQFGPKQNYEDSRRAGNGLSCVCAANSAVYSSRSASDGVLCIHAVICRGTGHSRGSAARRHAIQTHSNAPRDGTQYVPADPDEARVVPLAECATPAAR